MNSKDSLTRTHPNQLKIEGTIRKPEGARLAVIETHSWFGIYPMVHGAEIMRVNGGKKWEANMEAMRRMTSGLYDKYPKPLLCRPQEQWPNTDVSFFKRNARVVQDISDSGRAFLKDNYRYAEYPRSGSYYHQLGEGIAMAEFYIGATGTKDYTFTPRHQLTTHPNEFNMPITYKGKTYKKKLRMDGTFSVDYGGKGRLFFFEINRGTLNSNNEQLDGIKEGKKTILQSLLHMRDFIGDGIYHQYFPKRDPNGQPLGALSLQLFTNEEAMNTAIKLLLRETEGKGNNYTLFRCDPRFLGQEFKVPDVSLDNWNGPWKRAGRPDIYINK